MPRASSEALELRGVRDRPRGSVLVVAGAAPLIERFGPPEVRLTREPLRHPMPGDALGDELRPRTIALAPLPNGLFRRGAIADELETEAGRTFEERIGGRGLRFGFVVGNAP
jgi:hypothetical protein